MSGKPLTFDQRIELLGRLLRLARAGKSGRVYCTGDSLALGVLGDIYGNKWPTTWAAALALADRLESEVVRDGPKTSNQHGPFGTLAGRSDTEAGLKTSTCDL